MDDTLREPAIVLVLQGDQAFWFRETGPEHMESYTETIEAGELDLHSCCPWIRKPAGSPMTRIQLVLDSHLDEVDRVRVPNLPTGWLRHLQCFRMKRRLRADFPRATIHRLAPAAALDAVSVVQDVLPEHWQKWLALLQQEYVSVSHVATSLELLCQYSSAHEGRQRKPVLFCIPVGEYSRHLLVQGGVPVFMRLVPIVDGEPGCLDEVAVDESLTHVRRQVIRTAEIPVVTLAETSDDEPQAWARVPQALARLCLGREARFQCVYPESARQSEGGAGLCDDMKTPVRHLDTLIGKFVGRSRRRTDAQWLLCRHHRFADELLQVSLVRNALQLRIRQLQKATLICAWMAAVAVVTASVHGVASARERARQSRQQQQMSDQIEQLSAVATELNRHPAFVMRSMERIAAHQATGPIDAGGVLTTVAEALQSFPALMLDDISWSVFYGEVRETAITTIEQVPARGRLWQEGVPGAQVQVELGGKVISEPGLRKQQETLEDFSRYLESLPGVTDVKIIESPVSVARSSKHLSQEASAYRLTLLMGVS